jgi:hypothetical protein
VITSSKRSAAAAALMLAAGFALSGCGGDDDAGAAGDSTATPAWDSTRAPGAAPGEDGETPESTDAPSDAPAADDGQPAAEGGDAPADQPGGDAAGEGGASGEGGAPDDGGDASGDEGGADGGAQGPPPVAPAGDPVDACALGAEAIAGVLGAGPTAEDLSDPSAFAPACSWTGAGGHEIIVSVAGFDDWVGLDDLVGSGAEAVDDLGSEAWASLESPSNAQVAWRRDDISVAVAASLDSGGEAMLDVARAIDSALREAGY